MTLREGEVMSKKCTLQNDVFDTFRSKKVLLGSNIRLLKYSLTYFLLTFHIHKQIDLKNFEK